MLSQNDCYLQPNSNLDIVVKNGIVNGFTIKDDKDKMIIPINDLFLYLEELPQEQEISNIIEFLGVTYLPYSRAYVFCKVKVNMVLKQCYVTATCDSYNEKRFKFNSFVEPKRLAPYTYIINDDCEFSKTNNLGNISLFNVKNGYNCSIGQDIKKLFDNLPLSILNIRLVVGEDDIHRLEIVFGDKKTFRNNEKITYRFS